MRNKQVRYVVLLGAISIVGIIGAQLYFLQKAWSIREKQFTQTLVIGLKNVAEKMNRLNGTDLPYGNPVRQLSSNYYVVDMNSVIDANILEFYLRNEMEKLNIRTDYEYAIYDCHTDRMVYGNYISASGINRAQQLSSNLPKYSGYLYYFGVRFPSLRSTIAWDMAIWFFLTIILLLSVTFFVYAILIILQQKRFSEMQKDFIGNMAHEFKTPLTTIGISSDTLISSGSQADPQRMEKYGTIIRQESRRLNMLVEKLLQVARLENRKIQLKREMIDLNALVATIADNFRESNDQSRQLEAELDPGTGFVSADIVHLTSILYNLIDNAIKYAGERPRVRIATTRDTGKVRLTVSDNGPGIDPRYRHKVFEKFFRIPSGDRHDVKGFGLGLYYVKILCRAHGWNIRLTGGPSGNGAAFTVEMTGKS